MTDQEFSKGCDLVQERNEWKLRAERAESERDQFKLDNISHRSAVQTLQTYMGLDNTKEGLRACLLAYEAVKAERDKALAALERISGNYSSNTFAHKEAQAAIGAIKKGT